MWLGYKTSVTEIPINSQVLTRTLIILSRRRFKRYFLQAKPLSCVHAQRIKDLHPPPLLPVNPAELNQIPPEPSLLL